VVAIPKYVDINVFVYWLGAHPQFGEESLKWVEDMETGPRKKYVTSALTLYELLLVISSLAGKSLKDAEFAGEVVYALISLKGLAIEPLKSRDALQAPSLMKKHGLDYEDSLHLATALRVGAGEIVSNDGDFDKTSLKRTF